MKIRFLLLSALLAETSQWVPAQEKRVLTLETCKELALKNNADIQTGRMDVEAASQTRKEAFTKYFPKISAGAVTYKADDNLVKGTIPPLGLETPTEVGVLEEGNLVTVSALQPVFAGDRL